MTLTITEIRQVCEELERKGLGGKAAFAVSDFGDHCHTQQLVALGEPKMVLSRKETAYSNSGWAIEDSEQFGNGMPAEQFDPELDEPEVVVVFNGGKAEHECKNNSQNDGTSISLSSR